MFWLEIIQHCDFAPLRFRYKKDLVRKSIVVWFIIPVLVAMLTDEDGLTHREVATNTTGNVTRCP